MNLPLTPIRFLRYAEQQYADRTAVVCGRERFTYREFGERVSRFASALCAAGVRSGDRVAFLSANCHRLLEAYYGVLEAKAVLLPLNSRLAPGELAYVLNDSGAKVLFLEKSFVDLVEGFRSRVKSIEGFYLLHGKAERDWLAPANYEDLLTGVAPESHDFIATDENAVAELFYTSGTSAEPKGVMLTHRNIYLHALNSGLSLHTKVGTVELHTIPLFHANGWGAAHFLTLLGGKHVMIQKFEPQEVFRLIEQEGVNSCSLVPVMATALVNCPERGKYDLRSLERITIGGAASSPSLIREVEEKLGCTCFSGYGLTETSPVLTIAPLKPGKVFASEQRTTIQAMTGYAIPGVELRVVDAQGEDVPHDGQTIGEIVARSDGVMLGYWNQPKATAESLRGGWFHTGDMATMNEDGYLLIVDRQKDIIVSGGENISSLEVEKALLAHPAVLEAAVIPVPDKKWGEVPKALVVLKPGTKVTQAELLLFCRSRMAHFKCPHSVDFLGSLPRTGTGKVLKRDLRKMYGEGETAAQPPASPVRRKESSA